MYDLERFKNEDVYIRITSLDHYNEVMKWLDSQGMSWISKESLKSNHRWYDRDKNTNEMYISYSSWYRNVTYSGYEYYAETCKCYKELKPNKKGESKMTLENRNMKKLYATIEKVYFNEDKRTTVIKFKDGETVKATASKDTEFSEYFGFVSAMMKHQFGKVENIETFIKRKGERQ